jgi:hypothetical protein
MSLLTNAPVLTVGGFNLDAVIIIRVPKLLVAFAAGIAEKGVHALEGLTDEEDLQIAVPVEVDADPPVAQPDRAAPRQRIGRRPGRVKPSQPMFSGGGPGQMSWRRQESYTLPFLELKEILWSGASMRQQCRARKTRPGASKSTMATSSHSGRSRGS